MGGRGEIPSPTHPLATHLRAGKWRREEPGPAVRLWLERQSPHLTPACQLKPGRGLEMPQMFLPLKRGPSRTARPIAPIPFLARRHLRQSSSTAPQPRAVG